MEATWCASSQLVSSDFGYGGIQGFITPISNNGSQPAWCTTKGGYGNFGQDQSVELGFWMPLSPPGIEALVIRSGTGNPSDNPYKHSKPRVLRVETEGTTWTWDLQGNTDFQAITFDNPIQSTWVRIVIEEAYLGENWSNTCISDLFAVFEVQ